VIVNFVFFLFDLGKWLKPEESESAAVPRVKQR
jgi:hypothetical protein